MRISEHPQPWLLRLNKDRDWDKYTGFDPALVLPDGLTEERAQQFLEALARFDNAKPSRDQFLSFSVHLTKVDHAVAKRFDYNCGISEQSRPFGRFVRYLETQGFTGAKLNQLIEASGQREQIELAASGKSKLVPPLERWIQADPENMLTLLHLAQQSKPELGARHYLDYLAHHIKPQYIEPMLLYIGQAIKETKARVTGPEFSDEERALVAQTEQAYITSGLAESVAFIRALANTQTAKSQKRESYPNPHAKKGVEL